MSKREAVRYYRRLKIIDHKLKYGKRKTLKAIYLYHFGLKGQNEWFIKRFHDRLWGSVISFDSLSNMHDISELLNLKLKIV